MISYHDALLKRLDNRIREIEHHIHEGGPSDWVKYREKVAMRKELIAMRAKAEELYRQTTGEDEDFEDDSDST